jgi:prolyl-tRNA synthetase
MLETMQSDLLKKARAFRDAATYDVNTYDEFKQRIEDGGFFIGSWCQSKESEAKVKEDTKATIRCLPLDANFQPIKDDRPCMITGARGHNVRAIFARSY